MSLEDDERRSAKRGVKRHLKALHDAGALREAPGAVLARLHVGRDYSILAPCHLVVESIIEHLAAKQQVLKGIEEIVSNQALIGSNTSALPITDIQSSARNPKRVLGLHWVSSSPFSFVVEVMGGDQTSQAAIKRACALVGSWNKTPVLSRQDAPGFICNRVGYAMLRECFALLDAGVATPQDIDNAVRSSLGTWLPFVGPFAYLDLTGLPVYATIMQGLLPRLSSSQEVPASMQKMVKNGSQGIANGRGFYRYEGAKKRDEFDDFRRDLLALMAKYEARKETR